MFKRAYSNAYLCLTLTTLFWAGNFIVGRAVHGIVPPIALSWSRWTLAMLIIAPFALGHFRRDWLVIRQNMGILVILGILGVGMFNLFQYIGLNYTTALNAVLIFAAVPVIIVVISAIVFSDRITIVQAVGIICSAFGVAIMVIKGDISALRDFAPNFGDLWIIAACFTWAGYTVFLRLRPGIHPLSFIFATFAIGALFNTPLMIGEHLSGWRLQPTIETIAAILYVAIFPSIASYFLFNRGVQILGGNRAGVFLYLVPLFGAALAIALLGETLRIFHIAGFTLILSGVVLASRRGRASSTTRRA